MSELQVTVDDADASINGDFHGAFIYLPAGVTVSTNGLQNVHLQGAHRYTPPLLRRPRLARLVPSYGRARATLAFMEYLTRTTA